jgi:multisubunit Na+/H+ antiporter MnhC subunit
VNFTIDLPPKISILSLENKTYNASNVTLDFTVNEAISKVTYSLDGQENVTVTGNTTLTGLSKGAHNVTVYGWDVAGNAGASETIYFNIEMPEPFPTALVIAASIASMAVIAIGLLVYFKKRKHQAEVVGSK